MNKLEIELRNVSKSYGKKVILSDLNFCIKKQQFVSIMGPSGCGKSTLLNVLGLLDGFEGEYYLNGRKVKRRDYPYIRSNHIGFVFQLYYLLPNLNVRDNILMPLMYVEHQRIRTAMSNFDRVVDKLGIKDKIEQSVDTLSGGEKQRVAIARAMILQPDILIADEPTGALDERNAKEVIGFFKEYVNEGHSVIMVTHNKQIGECADIRYTLCDGRLNEI